MGASVSFCAGGRRTSRNPSETRFDLFSGDYTGDDNPLSSGFYTLQLVNTCFDGE